MLRRLGLGSSGQQQQPPPPPPAAAASLSYKFTQHAQHPAMEEASQGGHTGVILFVVPFISLAEVSNSQQNYESLA